MLTLALMSLSALAWLLDLTSTPEDGFHGQILRDVATGLSALMAAHVLDLFFRAFLRRPGLSSGYSDRLQTMLQIPVYVMAVAIWLHYSVGLDVTSVLATSAVVSLVLGLALQATLGNLFTGLSLELERPIAVGDYIQKGSVEGEVIALKWRSVFIRTAHNTRIVLPNSGLTTDSVEVIRRSEPSRHMVMFSVGSHIAPMDVISTVERALRYGLPKVCVDPAPTVVLIGPDPHSGALRYGARFYTLDWLERSAISSSVYVRLWYALSRKNIAVAPETRLVWESGGGGEVEGDQNSAAMQGRSQASGSWPASSSPAVPAVGRAADLMQSVANDPSARLMALGEHRLYGPDEEIDLRGCIGVVLRGSAREEQPVNEAETLERIGELLKSDTDIAVDLQVPTHMAAKIAERGALALGPYAHVLAADYARRTDDPYLLLLALASHIKSEDLRRQFLEHSPFQPSRRLNAGAQFGWSALFGLASVRQERTFCNRSAEILVLSAAEARQWIAENGITYADLVTREPDLATLREEVFQAWLRQV